MLPKLSCPTDEIAGNACQWLESNACCGLVADAKPRTATVPTALAGAGRIGLRNAQLQTGSHAPAPRGAADPIMEHRDKTETCGTDSPAVITR